MIDYSHGHSHRSVQTILLNSHYFLHMICFVLFSASMLLSNYSLVVHVRFLKIFYGILLEKWIKLDGHHGLSECKISEINVKNSGDLSMLRNIVSEIQSSESSNLPGCLKMLNKKLFFSLYLFYLLILILLRLNWQRMILVWRFIISQFTFLFCRNYTEELKKTSQQTHTHTQTQNPTVYLFVFILLFF